MNCPKLLVSVPPKVTTPSKFVSVSLGDPLELDCLIEAFPKGESYWSKQQLEPRHKNHLVLLHHKGRQPKQLHFASTLEGGPIIENATQLFKSHSAYQKWFTPPRASTPAAKLLAGPYESLSWRPNTRRRRRQVSLEGGQRESTSRDAISREQKPTDILELGYISGPDGSTWAPALPPRVDPLGLEASPARRPARAPSPSDASDPNDEPAEPSSEIEHEDEPSLNFGPAFDQRKTVGDSSMVSGLGSLDSSEATLNRKKNDQVTTNNNHRSNDSEIKNYDTVRSQQMVTVKQQPVNQYTYKSRLTIAKMSADDYGEYICHSSNVLGSSETRVIVTCKCRSIPEPCRRETLLLNFKISF